MDTANGEKEHIYIKHDGSINNGFEIVSHPATLNYHKNNFGWDELMKKAVSMGYRSHETETCGLHVHVSRNALGNTYDEQDNTIAKILYFIETNWSYLIQFTRRKESNLARWANKYGVEHSIEATYNKAKGDYNRYRCLNLQNEHTIEFRIFRGTLKHSTFIATLQFIHSLCSVCMNATMDEVYKMNWYSCTRKLDVETYPELLSYLEDRNLY